MKKTYIVKAKSYQDAIKKVKALDGDFSEADHDLLSEAYDKLDQALKLVKDASWRLDDVKTPIYATQDACDEICDKIEDLQTTIHKDMDFEDKYGDSCYQKDSEDEYRIVKKAHSYLICKGKWVVAQYEDERNAKRNLARLRTGDPIDKE